MEVVNNKRAYRFEAAMPDGEVARIDYRWLKGAMVLMHTVVPAAWRGKGIGAELVKYVLDYVRSSGLKIVVYCPFAELYLKKHPEYSDLVVKQP